MRRRNCAFTKNDMRKKLLNGWIRIEHICDNGFPGWTIQELLRIVKPLSNTPCNNLPIMRGSRQGYGTSVSLRAVLVTTRSTGLIGKSKWDTGLANHFRVKG